jgi:hypothetical protein
MRYPGVLRKTAGVLTETSGVLPGRFGVLRKRFGVLTSAGRYITAILSKHEASTSTMSSRIKYSLAIYFRG